MRCRAHEALTTPEWRIEDENEDEDESDGFPSIY
jgi:hypothetical protein